MTNKTFIERFKQTEKSGIYLLNGRDQNKNCWYYVDVDKLKLSIFKAKVENKETINIDEFGKVIVSGWGVEPAQIVKNKIIEHGASYDAKGDAELAAYYKSKSDVFFLTAISEGKDCYYYVAVDGKLAEEFKRVCDNETPDFEDYGNIIESGWYFPSRTVIAYMKEKYGIDTPELQDA